MMYLLYYGLVDFFMGFVAGIKAFTAAVLGGIGSLPGAMLGGLLIGLIETLWSAYFSIDYKDVAAFSILAGYSFALALGAPRPAAGDVLVEVVVAIREDVEPSALLVGERLAVLERQVPEDLFHP